METMKRVTSVGGGKAGGLQVRVLPWSVVGWCQRICLPVVGHRIDMDSPISTFLAPDTQDMINAVTDENSPGASPQLLARIVDYVNRSPDK